MKTPSLILIPTLLVAELISPSSFAARRTFLSPSLYSTGQDPTAATVQDFNNDGKSDVATASQLHKDISVLLGDGKGGFTPPNTFAVGANVTGIASADLDGDGNADLVVTDVSKSVYIALGHGDGTFAPASAMTLANRPGGIAINDLDGDGILDLAIASLGLGNNGSVAILIGVGDGSFAAPVFYSFTPAHAAGAVVATDLNHDGHLDLAVALSHFPAATESLAILLGNGDGTFQPAVISVSGNASDIAAEDFNQDGNMDLALTKDGAANILLGNGDGTFQPPSPTGASASTVATADMNRDGVPDLVVGGTKTGVLLGNGDGTFGPVTTYGVGNVFYNVFAEVGYFNQDRYPDVIAQGNDHSLGIALGTREGTLRAPLLIYGGILPITTGDFDGDGNTDLVDAVPLSFLKGLGDGTFAPAVQIAPFSLGRLTATDLNGDHRLDLLGLNAGAVYTLLGNGDGTFQAAHINSVSHSDTALAVGDFNDDGKQDLALASSGSAQLLILLGNGDGTFGPELIYATDHFPQALIATDFDGDGNLDLAVFNTVGNTVETFLGNGDGTFAPPLRVDTNNPIYSASGDFNRDGKMDFVVGGNGLKVFLGNGDGTFQPPQIIDSDYGPVQVADLNGDDRLDITVSSESAGTMMVFRGQGDGTFKEGGDYGIGRSMSGLFVLADFNGDARPEAVVSDNFSTLSILLNISARR